MCTQGNGASVIPGNTFGISVAADRGRGPAGESTLSLMRVLPDGVASSLALVAPSAVDGDEIWAGGEAVNCAAAAEAGSELYTMRPVAPPALATHTCEAQW